MPDHHPSRPEPWHLDRRIPVAIIIALLIQTAAVFYWGGQIAERLESLEKRVIVNEADIKHGEAERSATAQSIARLEEQLSSVLSLLERIDRKVSRDEERRFPR